MTMTHQINQQTTMIRKTCRNRTNNTTPSKFSKHYFFFNIEILLFASRRRKKQSSVEPVERTLLCSMKNLAFEKKASIQRKKNENEHDWVQQDFDATIIMVSSNLWNCLIINQQLFHLRNISVFIMNLWETKISILLYYCDSCYCHFFFGKARKSKRKKSSSI